MESERSPEEKPSEDGWVRLISTFSVVVDEAGSVEISIVGPTIEIIESQVFEEDGKH